MEEIWPSVLMALSTGWLLLFVVVVIGLTQGMQPVVGYNFGARHFERVQKTLKKVIRIAVTIMGLGWVCSRVVARAYRGDVFGRCGTE